MTPLSTYLLDSASPFTYFLVNTGAQAGSLAQVPSGLEFTLRGGLIWGAVVVAGAVVLLLYRKSSSHNRSCHNYDKELDEIRRSNPDRAKIDK